MTTATVDFDTLPPIIGCQVMADHPELASLAEPAEQVTGPDYLPPGYPADLLAGFDQAISANRVAHERDQACLAAWDQAAWQIATTKADQANPGQADSMHRQLAEQTDRWLPAARNERIAAQAALEARHGKAAAVAITVGPPRAIEAPPEPDQAA